MDSTTVSYSCGLLDPETGNCDELFAFSSVPLHESHGKDKVVSAHVMKAYRGIEAYDTHL
jgi:hypothetical protein